MPVNLKAQPLKFCSTCHYWIYQYKGLCTRQNQGVGRFWFCGDWAAADDRPAPPPPESPASTPPAS